MKKFSVIALMDKRPLWESNLAKNILNERELNITFGTSK